MKFWMICRQSIWISLLAVLVAINSIGCDDSDDDPSVAPPEAQVNEQEDGEEADLSNPEDPNFPDGLHPTGAASRKIARLFARQIKPLSDAGGNHTNVVVCIGDSITARGYPPYLADETGMTVINAGKGGEGSGGTAGRSAGVIAEHRPAYLCILTGINDISGADASIETIVANIESIVNTAKDNSVIPIVGTLTPLSGSRKKWQADGQACSAAIRDMASRTGTRLADIAAAFD